MIQSPLEALAVVFPPTVYSKDKLLYSASVYADSLVFYDVVNLPLAKAATHLCFVLKTMTNVLLFEQFIIEMHLLQGKTWQQSLQVTFYHLYF